MDSPHTHIELISFRQHNCVKRPKKSNPPHANISAALLLLRNNSAKSGSIQKLLTNRASIFMQKVDHPPCNKLNPSVTRKARHTQPIPDPDKASCRRLLLLSSFSLPRHSTTIDDDDDDLRCDRTTKATTTTTTTSG